MGEWALRRVVMKTGLEGKKVKVRCGRGNVKNRESGICRKKDGQNEETMSSGEKVRC